MSRSSATFAAPASAPGERIELASAGDERCREPQRGLGRAGLVGEGARAEDECRGVEPARFEGMDRRVAPGRVFHDDAEVVRADVLVDEREPVVEQTRRGQERGFEGELSGVRLAERAQLAPAVLAERFEIAIAVTLAAFADPGDERLGHERVEAVPRLALPDTEEGGRGARCKRSRADREASERELLLGPEQLVRPGDGTLEGVLTPRNVAVAARQQAETIVQVREDLGHAQRANPRGRELDRERDAVEPECNLRDRRELCLLDDEAAVGRERAFREEPDGRRLGTVGVEWRNLNAMLAVELEWLARTSRARGARDLR